MNSNSICTLLFEEHLNANFQKSCYVFGMKREKQFGCAKTMFQSGTVKED